MYGILMILNHWFTYGANWLYHFSVLIKGILVYFFWPFLTSWGVIFGLGGSLFNLFRIFFYGVCAPDCVRDFSNLELALMFSTLGEISPLLFNVLRYFLFYHIMLVFLFKISAFFVVIFFWIKNFVNTFSNIFGVRWEIF